MTPPTAVAAAKPIGFLQYLESKLDVNLLEDLGKRLVKAAEEKFPGQTGAEKKAWCVQQAITVLEAFDDRIPVLGKYLDLELADWLEAWAVGMLIEYAWALVFGGAA
ncbi:hypothetical protein DKM44_02405 [Deinococcus irradiatisoli]|uniref:Uncharacterized protein n=1 Tax=Deinococcus irradiatisoli TaxID=2202254 RepID=A0A2Z3JJX3_9DEIO|nr:hypothetical protein [Deinococcus irradiatisoli]AWN22228.1 hypothetical protein DKM44_02405 [Deinococcus irradiatisoli]